MNNQLNEEKSFMYSISFILIFIIYFLIIYTMTNLKLSDTQPLNNCYILYEKNIRFKKKYCEIPNKYILTFTEKNNIINESKIKNKLNSLGLKKVKYMKTIDLLRQFENKHYNYPKTKIMSYVAIEINNTMLNHVIKNNYIGKNLVVLNKNRFDIWKELLEYDNIYPLLNNVILVTPNLIRIFYNDKEKIKAEIIKLDLPYHEHNNYFDIYLNTNYNEIFKILNKFNKMSEVHDVMFNTFNFVN